MARTFRDSLAYDLDNAFLNVGEFAEAFTLSRGTDETENVSAIVTTRSYDTFGANGIATAIQSHDFDLAATSYAINGVAVRPRTGDRLSDASGNVYEVLALRDKQCSEPVGGGGDMLRVFTKLVIRG